MAAYVPRPDHAFVGNHTYDIEWLTAGEWEGRRMQENADAVTFATQQYIGLLLHDGVQESHYQEVLLHELTHAAWDASMLTHVDLSEIEDHEEFLISAQSPPLLGILKSNPDIVKYLMSDGQVRR